jgi:shikimate dehydrogenase
MNKLLVGLIGAGIQRSRSPALHEEEARAQGLGLEYRLIDLDRPGLGVDALPRLLEDAVRDGYGGLNITFPCKQSVMPLLDRVSDEARAIGAVNTIVIGADGELAGHNTDSPGWSWGFRRALPGAKLDRVVLLGAGGAGSAIAHAAMGLGVRELVIVDRDVERAKALKGQCGGKARTEQDIAKALQGADGLVQATPVGMEKHAGLPLPESLLRKDLWISEVVYVPLETELLKAAKRIGCRVMDGGHMNVGQAALGFELFTGRKADVARMDAHFRRLVG